MYLATSTYLHQCTPLNIYLSFFMNLPPSPSPFLFLSICPSASSSHHNIQFVALCCYILPLFLCGGNIVPRSSGFTSANHGSVSNSLAERGAGKKQVELGGEPKMRLAPCNNFQIRAGLWVFKIFQELGGTMWDVQKLT